MSASKHSIIHVDMDAFYASVEQRDNPALRGKPVVVGGHLKRGVVLAASYEVRPFGVASAMPMARAMKLAPHAIIVPPRASVYAKISKAVFAVFAKFTPMIEPLSLDEAFLDVTQSLTLFGPAAHIAQQIRAQIACELHLPSSAGIAPVKFVAKMASDFAKPNGQYEVLSKDVVQFLAPLPIARLMGVGHKAEARLTSLGFKKIGDIAQRTPQELEQVLGSFGVELWKLTRGIDPRPVESNREIKSVGSEDTFVEDIRNKNELYPYLHSQAQRVAMRLRKIGRKARVIQLKIKLSDFTLLTRQHTLNEATDDDSIFYHHILKLLDRLTVGAVRLTGISAHHLVENSYQLTLFDTPVPRKTKLNHTLDAIAEKFGSNAICTADLLEENKDDESHRQIGAARFDR